VSAIAAPKRFIPYVAFLSRSSHFHRGFDLSALSEELLQNCLQIIWAVEFISDVHSVRGEVDRVKGKLREVLLDKVLAQIVSTTGVQELLPVCTVAGRVSEGTPVVRVSQDVVGAGTQQLCFHASEGRIELLEACPALAGHVLDSELFGHFLLALDPLHVCLLERAPEVRGPLLGVVELFGVDNHLESRSSSQTDKGQKFGEKF